MEFEEQRKEIDLAGEEQGLTRVALHGKNKTRKKEKGTQFSLINVLLIIFTLIPIGIFAFVIINLNSPKAPIEPTPEEQGLQIETSGKSSEGGGVVIDDEKEEKKKEQELAEKKEKEALAQAEEEKNQAEAKRLEEEKQQEEARKQEEAKKQEEARQQEEARKKEAERQQAEANKKQEQEKQNQNQQAGGKTHTVAPGETLYRISVNYYQTGDGVDKIMRANGLSSNSISAGQKLVIP